MSNLWIEIEALVLDGVPLDAVQGQRLAQLTEVALARLLDQRGVPTRLSSFDPGKETKAKDTKLLNMHVPAGANDARWAEELAMALFRFVDRVL